MTPSMYERVKNLFVAAGLTEGRIVQLLFFEDTRKATDSFIVFRPNGGTPIRKDLGAEHYVLVDVIGPRINARSLLRQCRKLLITCRTTPSATTV